MSLFQAVVVMAGSLASSGGSSLNCICVSLAIMLQSCIWAQIDLAAAVYPARILLASGLRVLLAFVPVPIPTTISP